MKTLNAGLNGMVGSGASARAGAARGWQRWAPYAAVAWSLIYAALGIYWLVGGRGYPYTPETLSDNMGPVVAWLGPAIAWMIVLAAGIPAAALGALMLRGLRGSTFRLLLITAGAVLTGILLLFMSDISLLITVGYTPIGLISLLTGSERGQGALQGWTQWTVLHQLLCIMGGFLWLGATISFARRSGDACLYCGRSDGSEGWTSPERARGWGRMAAYLAIVVPLFYVVTRYAWALGIPLDMTREYWLQGQERGTWIGGLGLATFGLVGAILILGLVQRWGEVFPRWMIGLAGRRVPIALAVVPASIVSVLLVVGGIAVWPGYSQMADAAAATGQDLEIIVGPLALFPFWGAALAVAALGYYFRRRGPCNICGRGASGRAASRLSNAAVAR